MPSVKNSVKIRRRGPKNARLAFAALGKTIEGFTEWQARTIGRSAAFAVRRGIQLQRMRHKPLSREYLREKLRQGLDHRILIATGDYVQSIGVQSERRFKKGYRVRVGVPPRRHNSGLTYNQLGRIHEFGAKRRVEGPDGKTRTIWIHARPHWRRVYNKIQAGMRTYRREASGRLVDRVRDELRRYWKPR